MVLVVVGVLLVDVDGRRVPGGFAGLPDALEDGDKAVVVDGRAQVAQRPADDLVVRLALHGETGGVEKADDVVAAARAVAAYLVDGAAARHHVEDATQEGFARVPGLILAAGLRHVVERDHHRGHAASAGVTLPDRLRVDGHPATLAVRPRQAHDEARAGLPGRQRAHRRVVFAREWRAVLASDLPVSAHRGLADRFLGRDAEDALGRRVPRQDATGRLLQDHALVKGGDDGVMQRLLLSGVLPEPVEQRLLVREHVEQPVDLAGGAVPAKELRRRDGAGIAVQVAPVDDDRMRQDDITDDLGGEGALVVVEDGEAVVLRQELVKHVFELDERAFAVLTEHPEHFTGHAQRAEPGGLCRFRRRGDEGEQAAGVQAAVRAEGGPVGDGEKGSGVERARRIQPVAPQCLDHDVRCRCIREVHAPLALLES